MPRSSKVRTKGMILNSVFHGNIRESRDWFGEQAHWLDGDLCFACSAQHALSVHGQGSTATMGEASPGRGQGKDTTNVLERTHQPCVMAHSQVSSPDSLKASLPPAAAVPQDQHASHKAAQLASNARKRKAGKDEVHRDVGFIPVIPKGHTAYSWDDQITRQARFKTRKAPPLAPGVYWFAALFPAPAETYEQKKLLLQGNRKSRSCLLHHDHTMLRPCPSNEAPPSLHEDSLGCC